MSGFFIKAKTLFYFILILPVIANAAAIDAGFNFGGRTIGEKSIRDTYGTGIVVYPYLSINPVKNIHAGVAYEGGYTKNADLGIYREKSKLKISGIEFFLSYQFRIRNLAPYVRFGYASYSYKHSIDSEAVDYAIDKNKGTVTFGAGLKFFVGKGFFLCGDMRYVPLKVKPVEVEVDLGGLRYTFGAGYSFKL